MVNLHQTSSTGQTPNMLPELVALTFVRLVKLVEPLPMPKGMVQASSQRSLGGGVWAESAWENAKPRISSRFFIQIRNEGK